MDTLSSQYRFDNFAEVESSRLAFAACRAVAEGIRSHGNPLVLVGGTGLGKTHLLYSIAVAMQKKDSDLKIIYTTVSEFCEKFVKYIQKKNEAPNLIEEMSAKFRNADVLLLDDLQNIEGNKTHSQNELLQIFNTLLLAEKPIIVASQVSISSIENLNDSLRSRLTGGLVIQMSAPIFNDRLIILQKKFDTLRLNVDENIVQFLAEKINGTVRDLEGVVSNIGFKVRQNNKNADLEMAAEILEEHFSNSYKTISTEQIVKKVSAYYSIPIETLRLKGRGSKEAVLARQVAMYFIRGLLHKSFDYIGKYFNRNHATALYACKMVNAKIKKEIEFNLEVKKIKKNLQE